MLTIGLLPAQAQSIAAAADGTGTVVTQQEGTFSIEQGSRSADGANLFHSFDSFSLTTAEAANFVVESGVQNVLSRVNSSTPSVIDGLIQTSGSGQPNVYLMNPAGLLFGPNARLNLPASLTVTTADAIAFEEGWFRSTGDRNYESLLNAPTGEFLFSSEQSGAIANQANLALNPGASLSLLGGSIHNTGTLLAPNGAITLAATHATELVLSGDGTARLIDSAKPVTGGTFNVFGNQVNLTGSQDSETVRRGNVTLSAQSLSGLSASAELTIEANDGITVQPLPNQTLAFTQGNSAITFRANADGSGQGNFVMLDPDTTLLAPGRNLSISGENLVVGDLYTALISQGGSVNLAAKGSIAAGNIYTHSLSSSGQSGDVTITAADVTTGTIYSRGANGPGNVDVTSRTGDISTGNIVTGSLVGNSLSSMNGIISLTAPNSISVAEEIIQRPTGRFTDRSNGRLPGVVTVASATAQAGGGISLQLSASESDDEVQGLGAKSTVLSTAEANAAIARSESRQGQKFSSYFGQNLSQTARSLKEVQQLLIQKEQETGTRSAVIYVTTNSSAANENQPASQFTFGSKEATPNALELVIITADSPAVKVEHPNLDSEELQATVTKFRSDLLTSMRRGGTPYLSSAQQLYQWLVAPIEDAIASAGSAPVSTLAFAMDTGLRTLPLAALHDGNQFLIEKYSVGMLPSLGLINADYTSLENAEVTSTGASRFEALEALPAVPLEVDYIHSQWPGPTFLNEDFTRDNLVSGRSQSPTQVVHLATHAEFNAGGIDQSYIQLWDEKISLQQLSQLGWQNPAVDLLVLSACRTAVGSAEAELGFAGLAVSSGVRSAMASLWSVDDVGTLALMHAFYQQLGSTSTKSEALRQTQLALLNEAVYLESGKLVNKVAGSLLDLSTELGTLKDKNFSHPYYWSSFVMVGSPW